MSTKDVEENEYADISQPEVLSVEKLKQLLSNGGVDVSSLAGSTKDELVEEYYKRLCPLPQRKYRPNRRGIKMTRNQNIVSKRKRTYDESEACSASFTIQERSSVMKKTGLVNVHLPTTPGSRLKAPPSAINTQRKVIKLSSSCQASDVDKGTMQTSENGSKHCKITFTSSASPGTELKAQFDNIQIHQKDYTKPKAKENGNEKSQNCQATETLQIAPTKIKLSRKLETAPTTGCVQKVAVVNSVQKHEQSSCQSGTGDAKVTSSISNLQVKDEPPAKKFQRTKISWP